MAYSAKILVFFLINLLWYFGLAFTMELKRAKKGSAFDRLGGRAVSHKVCTYWLAGRCNRNPCRFIHTELESDASPSHFCGAAKFQRQCRNMTWKSSNYSAPMARDEERVGKSTKNVPERELRNGRMQHEHMDWEIANASTRKDDLICAQPKVLAAERTETDKVSVQATHPIQCKYWISGNCVHGDKCTDLHCWFYGSGFTMLTKLEGHCKVLTS